MDQQKEESSFGREVKDPLADPKNSRILNRKQIEKRLQGLKSHEYENICANLENQNNRLKKQVTDLHQKVQELMISKKIPQTQNNPLIEDEIKSLKKEMDIKYEKMSYLKQQIRKKNAQEYNEGVKLKMTQDANKIYELDQELKNLTREKMKLGQIYEKNCEAMEEYFPKEQDKDDRINEMKQENRELKMKLNRLGIELKTNDKNSQQALDKLYMLKLEEQRYINTLAERKKDKKKSMITEMKSIDLKEINDVKKEVEELKRRKKNTERELENQRVAKEQKKLRLERQVKENLEFHKDLLRKRMKALNHLNLYEAKDKQQRERQQAQIHKQNCTYEERGSQTDKIVPKDFRRQWIGKSEGISFDDSNVVDFRGETLIKGAIIYKTADHIVFIKFFYESPNKKRFQSKVPFDIIALRKFQSKKHFAKSGFFLKSFKLSLTNDKITKIELIWSDGQSAIEGWDIDSSTKYMADIEQNQKPVSMYGTVSFQGKNNYALSSLGCEVNQVESE